jgi:hypothetical protein
MIEEYEEKRRKQVSFWRSLLDYIVGTLIIGAGVFFFFRDTMDIELNKRFVPNIWDKIFGIICVAYGAWRIYRGYKKNYFR